MSKFSGNHNVKDHAEPESSPRNGDGDMISLEMLMAALRLVSEQRAAERIMHHHHEREEVSSTASPTLRNRSPSISTTSSLPISTTCEAPVNMTMGSSSSRVHAREAECAGFQYVNAEEGPEDDRGEVEETATVAEPPVLQPAAVAQPPAAPPSTRWYCITRGRAVGVFAEWHNASPLITNVPGAVFQRYPTFNSAVNAFVEASANGHAAIIFT